MNILHAIGAALQFLSEGAVHIFSRSKDEYPAIGIQPFDGEPFSEWVEVDKR
jgi:hypothetical protein